MIEKKETNQKPERKDIKMELLTKQNLKDPKRKKVLSKFFAWWALQTRNPDNPHLVPREEAYYWNNLVIAVKGTYKGKFVAAGGVVICLNRKKKILKFKKRIVVELISNYVDPILKGLHMGNESIQMRTEEAIKNRYFPIIVTREPKIIKYLIDLGWKSLGHEYHEIIDEIRICGCHDRPGPFIGKRCNNCPLWGRMIWTP